MTIVIERFTDKEPIKFTNVTEVPKVVTLGNIAYFEKFLNDINNLILVKK